MSSCARRGRQRTERSHLIPFSACLLLLSNGAALSPSKLRRGRRSPHAFPYQGYPSSWVCVGEDRLRSEVPEGKACRRIQHCQPELAWEHREISSPPEHLLEATIDDGQRCRKHHNLPGCALDGPGKNQAQGHERGASRQNIASHQG